MAHPDVAIQPFLLIVRTLHVVTVVACLGDWNRLNSRLSVVRDSPDFPAFGQIYRQQFPLLSHDVLNPARVPL